MSSPITVTVGSQAFSGMAGALSALTLEPFLSGELPHVTSRSLASVDDIAELLPCDAVVDRSIDINGHRAWNVRGDGWLAHLERHRGTGGLVDVYARSAELAEAMADDIASRCALPAPSDAVEVTLWHWSNGSPSSRTHAVRTSAWADVSRNYASTVRDSVDALAKLTPADDAGRIIVFHGVPGTGKTSAVRALLHEWREWAIPHIVLDGDLFVDDAGYITDVTTRDQLTDRWVVVVIEDAGDIVSEENAFKGRLSCLLNISDGLTGLGTKALFLLTTNEPVYNINTALVRPGRCLANVEFTPLPRREAIEWLDGDSDVPYDGLTLAELYERTSATPQISNITEPERHGVYL